MTSWTFEATARGYANLWRSITIKGGDDAANADRFASKIIAAEQRYKSVQAKTGVPWYLIGALHMRESSCNFATHLHNGDPLTARTVHVPAGHPKAGSPPFTWEESAVDALKLKDLDLIQDWSAAYMGYTAEIFNGIGYVGKGVNSPYVWAGSNHEQTGKYVADHEWDELFDDPQIGVMTVIKRLTQLRPDIAADLAEKDSPAAPIAPAPTAALPSSAADVAQTLHALASLLAMLRPTLERLMAETQSSSATPAATATGLDPRAIAVLTQIVGILLGGRQAPAEPPPAVVETAPAPSAPVLPTPAREKPSVQLSAFAFAASTLLQILGVVGTPGGMGEAPTTIGTIATAAPILTGLVGMTGGWGAAVNLGLRLLGAFAAAPPKR